MKKRMTRRDLFRYSATAGLGALIVPQVSARTSAKPLATEKILMPERVLGRTGLKFPILSMGVNRADNPNILWAAYNAGIFHFDTGYSYQNGKSEEMIGNVLAGKPRESVNIATKTKFDYPLRDDFEETLNLHVDTSLSRMKIDYVDIFYAHDISSVEKLTDSRVLAALTRIKESGKARFLAFSSHDQDNSLLEAAVETGVYDVAMITYNFKVNHQEETDRAIEKAAKAGLGIIAMKVMAGGTEDGEGKTKINGKACLKWIWQNPYITTVVPCLANYDQLDDCLAAVREIELTPTEEQYLDRLRTAETIFCQQCKQCETQCPKHLPVPDLMRAYMYAYGYKQARLSKETLLEAGLSDNACDGCDTCQVHCPCGFQMAQKIAALQPLTTIPDIFLT
ncbi:MAG: aldo/keto reductase [Tannerellaceae bacterium]|nr:aldo/keto reductase [Tannerellaceae bacterium]